jgi:hypothetical protein
MKREEVMVAKRQLFRTQALQEYAQGREKEILLRLVRPPVLLCGWLLLGLLFAATLLAWQTRVAVSVEVAGIIAQETWTASTGASQVTGVLFVPASTSRSIPAGQSVMVQLTGQAAPLHATIISVDAAVITPAAARQQYGLSGDLAWVITQPSVVVTFLVSTDLPASALTGRSVVAEVRVGSRTLLSLLPDVLNTLW